MRSIEAEVEPLEVFCITENPSDHPGQFVVRKHTIANGRVEASADPCAITETLHEARASIPAGRVNIGRDPGDDPVIVESWV